MVKKASKSSKKESKKKVKATPAPTPVVEVVETPPAKVEVESPVDFYEKAFGDVSSKLKDAMVLIRTLTQKVTALQKRVVKDQKAAAKRGSGRAKKPVDPNKPPSGFAKPGPISSELATFLGLPADKEVARTEVTKMITEYCKEHNLQKSDDKRVISADAKLKKLLKLPAGETLTFFNLQKYMKVHYPKKVAA